MAAWAAAAAASWVMAGLPDLARSQEAARTTRTVPPAFVLTVEPQPGKVLTFSPDDLARLPRRTLEATDHGGKPVRFEGVPLVEILKAAGAPLGETLRGPELSKVLVVEAADGYKAAFALPELDPAFTDEVVLLADRRDGQPLSAGEGPLRLVVPHEKRQARWVRQVTALRVRDAASGR